MRDKLLSIFGALLLVLTIVVGCGAGSAPIALDQIPAFSGEPYVAVHGNQPYFTKEELTTTSFESYAPLDVLGRCGVTVASVGRDLMPNEERGSIGGVKPTGWHTAKYDCVDGKYLYNRCHLIGFQLTGENDNKSNLITGTRYLNIEGMLPFENMVADYVKETGNHVMYRVTPIFEGNNLVASGVLMEGYSVEDDGAGICYCVFAYNAQPGVVIDYATGESTLDAAESGEVNDYILNTKSKKFHHPDCSGVAQIKKENQESFQGSRSDLIHRGYSPCGICHP